MGSPELRKLRLWQDRVDAEVEIAGTGPPLVYLHGPWGLSPDRAFIALLADSYTVHAPRHPGTTPGDPDAVHLPGIFVQRVVEAAAMPKRIERLTTR